MTQKFIGGQWEDIILLNVEKLNGQIIGTVSYPRNSKLLDIMDDPLTVWASDRGYNVDEVFVDLPETYFKSHNPF